MQESPSVAVQEQEPLNAITTFGQRLPLSWSGTIPVEEGEENHLKRMRE